MNSITNLLLAIAIALRLLGRAAAIAAPTPPPASHTPVVHVVFMVDPTGSFRDRVQAEKLTVDVIRSLAPDSVDPRRAPNPTVFWSIVSLDSYPSGAIASGTEQDLDKISDGKFFERIFADRKAGLANCSDVLAAFNVAVDALGPPDSCSNRVLYVTSDLKAEPPAPTPKKPNTCKPATFAPPAGMPWDKLAGVTVKTFFTPAAAIAAWTPVVQQHGLDFTMYTGSGPEGRLPKPQPNPRCAPDRELPMRLMRKAGVLVSAVIVALILFIGGLAALARRQPKPAARPTSGLRPVLKGQGRPPR